MEAGTLMLLHLYIYFGALNHVAIGPPPAVDTRETMLFGLLQQMGTLVPNPTR